MQNRMMVLPGQILNGEREIEELLKRADLECEQRMKAKGTAAPKATGKSHYNDALQTRIQTMVNRAFNEARKRPAASAGANAAGSGAPKQKIRLEDISDDVLIRSITEPTIIDLDKSDHQGPRRSLSSLDDDELSRVIMDPKVLDLR